MKEWRVTHGKSNTPEYRAWHGMRQRCTNPKSCRYKSYGGRGIKVCERWNLFENFFQDMGPRPSSDHSIDRIDNDGNYDPSNCRWATRSEQQKNKTTYNSESLPRGDDHWTRRDKERAASIARQNIRKSHKSGEENASAKLTMEKAEALRAHHKSNPSLTMASLGQLFGIGRELARLVVRGIAWR